VRVGRGIALLFHDRSTRRWWASSSTPRPHFTPGKDLVPVVQEARWAPGPVWTGGKSRLHRDSIPDRPARSQSLYRLRYPAHKLSLLYRVFFHWHNPSSYTMVLELTQLLTEISTRNISWGGGGKSGLCVGLTNLPPSCADFLEMWGPHSPGTLWTYSVL